MSVWIHGTQGVQPDEMLNILKAVSALHQMTNELQKGYVLPFPLKIGAGINTGYAMVGNTGTGARPDYTALGDTVNAAFRLETATKEIGCDLALGDTTYQCVHPLLLQKRPDPFRKAQVQLKGYDNLTITYATTYEYLNKFLTLL